MGYMTIIDIDLFKNELVQTLVKHPRFSSLLIEKDKRLGKYSWKRTKVDIEKHVFAPELDPDMESPDEFVEKFVSALSRQTLDPTKPLWEIHVLNVKTSDANSTAVFKIFDHSIGDGVSLISLVLACAAMRRSSNNPGVEYLPVMPSKKQKTNIGILVVMKRLFLSFWTGFFIIYYTLIDLIMVLATMLFLKDTKTPIKGERGVENSPKRFVHRIFDLDDVKLVKNAMHVVC
ncbi:PREDICTED: O-acyltransferase WSD1-like [Erythranthe guttata]|uniref:O-acyltransferase WSD1-like n=1 Tax=Erythranthe guttata TaxID=4155 RepID=UPI00064DCC23|nr:PREDICTED: O-acyltransferase WSD1-like [Erythranthe guttata]|eukprot:XP_012853858.1 PREDICTED: O-acyltransferase WSD1-like [Erythranthe guttata]